MDLASITLGIFFLVQLVGGSLGNLSILLTSLYVETTEGRLRPVDAIVSHLAFVNLIAFLIRGIPQVKTLFGAKEILNDAGCKTVIYVYRVTRALSVSTTCTLSVFQSATIAPVTSCLWKAKHIIPKYLINSFIMFWMLNFLSFTYIIIYTGAPKNNTFPPNVVNLGFCYAPYLVPFTALDIFVTVMDAGQNAMLISIMILASCYILLTLKRHRQQVGYITASSQIQAKEVEVKASKTIIRLVALYGIFYTIEIVINVTANILKSQSTLLSNVRVFLSFCYQFFSPFILASFNKKSPFKLLWSKQNPVLSTKSTVPSISQPQACH